MKRFGFLLACLVGVVSGGWFENLRADQDLPPDKQTTVPASSPVEISAEHISKIDKVFVHEFRFEGNTVFSDRTLAAEARTYARRKITFEELMELRHRLTRYYIDRGYINSGVIVPDQRVTDGIINLRIIEGRLTRIEVADTDLLRPEYVRRRLALGAGTPLNIDRLQKQIQLLHQDPLIQRINAELGPGERPGEAVLHARVQEAPPLSVSLQLANDRSPSLGGNRLQVLCSHGNISGRGDRFSMGIGLVRQVDDLPKGMNDLEIDYQIPLSARDTRLRIYTRLGDAVVVEEPLDEIDIGSRSNTYGLSVTHPFFRQMGRELALGLAFEKRQSKTSLLGESFSFSKGVEDGESDVSVLRFSQQWLSRSVDRVLAVRSVFSWGFDALEATVHDDLPDGNFFAWLGQIQWARRFERLRSTQVVFRTDVQLAGDALLPMEKFAVGGIDSVRGYRKNLMVRDNGLAASLEARIPLLRIPLPYVTQSAEEGELKVVPFVDFGWSRNRGDTGAAYDTIGSAGLGLRWTPISNLRVEVYWASPFRHVESITHTLQDEGVHFRLLWQVY